MTVISTPVVGSGHANEVVLKKLGCILISASRLERVAVELARGLKLDTDEKHAIAGLQKSTVTPPPWSTATQKSVAAWASATGRLLETRSAIFEASGAARFGGSRGDTIATTSSDGSVFPADEEYLSRLAMRLERHLTAGSDLAAALDYQDDKGRRWPLVAIHAHRQVDPEASPALRLPLEWERWLSA